MKNIKNFSEVQAKSGEFNRPKAGGYIIEILNAVDVPMNEETGKGDYLKLEYDIADGEFSGYFTDLNDKFGGEYRINFIRSYKESALGMFKHFINCLEGSNPSFHWEWDENAMKGCLVGAVLQEEEYRKRDGSVGTRLVVRDIKTTAQIIAGDFKIYDKKTVTKVEMPQSYASFPKLEELGEDEELPF